MSQGARLRRIRQRIEQLRELDQQRQVFGASTHDWLLEAPLERAQLEHFEQAHGVTLPEQLREYMSTVSSCGAGPYYGLLPLPLGEYADELLLAAAFVGDLDDPTIDRDPRRSGGYLPLAEQGCGYRSVMPLAGPRRGQVLADLREAHDGFVAESQDFFAWMESWLERALAEWAEQALPDIVAQGGELPLADELAALLERRADERSWAHESSLYPLSATARVEALLLLRIVQGRSDEAEALLDRLRAVDHRDAEARAWLNRARIAAAREQQHARIAAADAGLALADIWFETRSLLLRERERALDELGRREEAIATAILRAEHSKHPHAWFDVAWMHVSDGAIEPAAALLLRAAQELDDDDGSSFVGRVERFAEGLLGALIDDGQDDAAEQLRERLRELAMRAQPN